ncbi:MULTISPECIES: hypothetical protein [Bacteroidales]|jgi:hypothetical protein|uniref:Uncharacterized protein n=2 Tax=Xylanibacter TaxID=558436 RepID=A0ABX2B070_9BACT|nr:MULTISPECIES: hypothetical protein [Bacteroidales]NPE13994.1 hypothetical protein [Xylanibacter rodentium]NPE24233.1 hypothetical protein [Xylanibacter caecicola]DAM50623.1 MAG TPA: hypothetical protein [Caudoviricetes sp.]
MKKNVLNYLKVAVRLPLAVLGGLLKITAVVFQVLSFLVHGDTEGAKTCTDTLKRI